MKALKLTEPHTLEFQELSIPVPEPDEVIIKTAYCGICRTDRKAYHMGQRDLYLPRVLGHEFSGTVYSAGENVKEFTPGMAVAVHPGIGCGTCPDCLTGNDQRCRDMQILGFHLDGGFSPYCRIPADGLNQKILFPLSGKIQLKDAASAEPMACAIHMLDDFIDTDDHTILIYGGGVLGLLTASLCHHCFGSKSVIVEGNPMKRQWIDGLKIDYYTVLSPEQLDKYLADNYPKGVDAAIPCCPHNEGFTKSLQALKNGGKFGFFSGLTSDEPPEASVINLIHYKELKVKGSYGCGRKDFAAAINLLAKGFSLDTIPRTFISLEEAPEILTQLETDNNFMTIIEYGKDY